MEEKVMNCLEKANEEIQDRKNRINELNKQKKINEDKRKNLLQVKKMFGKDDTVYKVADEESKEKLKLIKATRKEMADLKGEIKEFKQMMTTVVEAQKEIEEKEKRIEEIKKERESIFEEREKLLKVKKLFDKEDKVYVVARKEDKEKLKMLKEKSKELIQLNEEIEEYKGKIEEIESKLGVKTQNKEEKPEDKEKQSKEEEKDSAKKEEKPNGKNKQPKKEKEDEDKEIEIPDLDESLKDKIEEQTSNSQEADKLSDEEKKAIIARKIEEGRKLRENTNQTEEKSALDTLEELEVPEEKKIEIVIGRTVNVIDGKNKFKLSTYQVKNVISIANGIGVMGILTDNGIRTEDIEEKDILRLFNEKLVDPIVIKALAENKTLKKEERHDMIKQYIKGDVSNISIVYDAKALSKGHIFSKLMGNTELEDSDKAKILEFGEKAKENEIAQIKGEYKLGFLDSAINMGKSLFSRVKKTPKFPKFPKFPGKGDPKPKEETTKEPEQEPKDGKKAFEDEISRNGELKGKATIQANEISENVVKAYEKYKTYFIGQVGKDAIDAAQLGMFGLKTQLELDQFKKLWYSKNITDKGKVIEDPELVL